MYHYLIVESHCKCDLKVLGTYESLEEAEEAAAIFESCGVEVDIIKEKK